MSTRKKSQTATPSQPFKFADPDLLMENAAALMASDGRSNPATLLKWKLRAFYPAYSLGELIGARLNEFVNMTTPPSALGIGSERINHYIASLRNPETAQIYKDLWQGDHKFHVMWARQCGINNGYTTQREWGQTFDTLFDYFVNNNATPNAWLPNYVSSNRGAAGLIRRFFHGEGTETAMIESKTTKTGEFAQPIYSASRYTLIYLQKHSPNAAAREFTAQWVRTNIELDYSPIPLAVLVFRLDQAHVIRAHWLNNLPLEASMFQLWVDKSLDAEDSPHPLRTQYVRSIRNPLRKLGVEVVVKDDLRTECFNSMDVPKFKTIKDEKLFVGTKVEEILNEERRRLGVTRAPIATEETPMAMAMEDIAF